MIISELVIVKKFKFCCSHEFFLPEWKDGEEQRLTLQKDPDGLGLQLSTGPPPVIVKYVDPGK